MNEEEILRQRLLTKETNFKKCFKRFVSLKSAIANNDAEQCKETCHELAKDLQFWELTLGKAAVVSECNIKEVAEYSNMLKTIEKSIEEAKGEIEHLQAELVTARTIRQNKEEYENIARLINEYPARVDTEKELADLNEEIRGLQEERDGLSNKMSMRSKQFHLLLHTVQDLQNSLEAEEEQEKAAMEEDQEATASDQGGLAPQEDIEMADADNE